MSKIMSKCSKKSLQAISKADYQIKNLKSNEFKLQQSKKNLKHYSSKQNSISHFVIDQSFQGQPIANSQVVIDSIKKLYFTHNTSRIDENFYIKNHQINSSFFAISEQFSQIIEIYQVQRQVTQNQRKKQTKIYKKISIQTPIIDKSIKQKQFLVYVVHHCNLLQYQKSSLRWDKFVQKYEFKKKYNQAKQTFDYIIKYSMIFSYSKKSNSSLNFLKINKFQNIVLIFLKHYFDQISGNYQAIKKLQGYIFQHQKILKQLQLQHNEQRRNLPCYSLQLKRQTTIPAQIFMEYQKLKEQLYRVYMQLNTEFIKKKQIIDYQMKFQNTVCKFMFEHNNNLKIVKQKVLNFIKWENQLRKNHDITKFQKYLDMDILIQLGNDRMGRPVVLFKISNFIADNITDTKDYYNFFFYFLIIYLMRNSKGYTDDFIFIGDASNTSSKNFKMDLNILIIKSVVQMIPLHIRSLIIYGNNSITFLIYKIVKPLLPDYAQEGIKMYREDYKQVRQFLLTFMDDSVIPQLLGGKNKMFNEYAKIQVTEIIQFTPQTKQKKKVRVV